MGPYIRPSAPAGFHPSHLDLSDLDRTTALLLEAIRSGVAVDDQACLDLAGALADEGRNDELAHVLRAGFSLGSLRCLAWLAADLPERLTVEELLVAARIEHDAVLAGLLRVLPERRLHDLGALVLTQRLGTAAPTDDVRSLTALSRSRHAFCWCARVMADETRRTP